MSNLAEYFSRTSYKPVYQIGDRVFGRWNKIPFIGSVGNDSCVDGVTPRVSVHLDLPIKHKDKIHNILFIEHKDIKSYLVNYDTTSSKKSS
jgi:hypothetical protein